MTSTIKVNNIQNQCGANIINESANTITIGASGDTISLAAGASQTGFGRTGTVDWDTTAKTASFTAVSGNGYFVNTTSGAITLTLPASPSAGDIVSFKDYAYTFATNNLTVDGNSSPIGGESGTVSPTYSTNGTSKTFIYVDGTKGWLVTNESTDTSQEQTPTFITATGGTVTTSGDFKIHSFTGPGTFTVCSVGNPAGSDTVNYLVVAGGGGSSSDFGGGGGAGGYRASGHGPAPLQAPSIPVSATGYPITVGSGGTGAPTGDTSAHTSGNNSIFSTITSAGGGKSGFQGPTSPGTAGGSGGGGAADSPSTGGAGNTPPVSPPQGNAGGPGCFGGAGNTSSGGGGGATAVGDTGSADGAGYGGDGGAGATNDITGSSVAYAGGGGGAGENASSAGGTGGGGGGAAPSTPGVGNAGTANTGGGAGGGAGGCGAGGGSGIVIIRYKFQ